MKPILFNTDMVRAILDGRKTVTRRVVKPRYGGNLEVHDDPFGTPRLSEKCGCLCRGLKPPYRPGDILYVRETWRVQSAHRFEADARIEFKAGGDLVRIQFPGGGTQYHSRRQYDAFVSKWANDRWHPSIHMPREAARIFLRVTGVRVERLQSMRAHDSQKEGVPLSLDGIMSGRPTLEPFARIWDSTIKPADRALYGWEANPWVWVIEFERCEKPEGGGV